MKTSSDWDVSGIVYMEAMQKKDEWPRCEIKRGLLSQIPFDKRLMGFQLLPPAAVTQPGLSSPSVSSLGPELAFVFHRWTWLIYLDSFPVAPAEMTTRPLLSFSHFFVIFLIFLQSVWNGCLISQCCLTAILSTSREILLKADSVSVQMKNFDNSTILYPLFFLSFSSLQTWWKPLIWNV